MPTRKHGSLCLTDFVCIMSLGRPVQGAQDAKKAKVWGTLAKKIVQAAKAGGADPAGNAKLAEIIKACKAVEVPKDIIDRNLKKATEKNQSDFQEVRHRMDAPLVAEGAQEYALALCSVCAWYLVHRQPQGFNR